MNLDTCKEGQRLTITTFDRPLMVAAGAGSGKTFTVANVIAQLNRPTLVLSHNKTLAAQLYGEFRNFFPENAVEYFCLLYTSPSPRD